MIISFGFWSMIGILGIGAGVLVLDYFMSRRMEGFEAKYIKSFIPQVVCLAIGIFIVLPALGPWMVGAKWIANNIKDIYTVSGANEINGMTFADFSMGCITIWMIVLVAWCVTIMGFFMRYADYFKEETEFRTWLQRKWKKNLGSK
jgi:hypothetical protein